MDAVCRRFDYVHSNTPPNIPYTLKRVCVKCTRGSPDVSQGYHVTHAFAECRICARGARARNADDVKNIHVRVRRVRDSSGGLPPTFFIAIGVHTVRKRTYQCGVCVC